VSSNLTAPTIFLSRALSVQAIHPNTVKLVAGLIVAAICCFGCSTVPRDKVLEAQLRALPGHSLVAFGTPGLSHDGGSTGVILTFNNGQEYLLRCLCVGNILHRSWKTNDWKQGYRFQIYQPDSYQQVETIKLDSPLANRLSVLLRQFSEDHPAGEWSHLALSFSRMMHRRTYDEARATAGLRE
jgi:hypothetical protein